MRPEQVKLLVTPGCRGFFPATIEDLRRASTGKRVIAIIGKNLRLAIEAGDNDVVPVVSSAGASPYLLKTPACRGMPRRWGVS
jgi:hypothetical protein